MLTLESRPAAAQISQVEYVRRLDSPSASPLAKSGWTAADAELNDWTVDPDSVVDADAVAPSRTIIRRARTIIAKCQQLGLPAPSMVVPDGNGGISFEFHSASVYRNLEVLKDGRIRWTVIKNGQIESRRFID